MLFRNNISGCRIFLDSRPGYSLSIPQYDFFYLILLKQLTNLPTLSQMICKEFGKFISVAWICNSSILKMSFNLSNCQAAKMGWNPYFSLKYWRLTWTIIVWESGFLPLKKSKHIRCYQRGHCHKSRGKLQSWCEWILIIFTVIMEGKDSM